MSKKSKTTYLTVDRLESDSRFEFGILSKIVLTFVILSLVPMGFLGLISLEGMDSIGDTSIQRSSFALEQEANASLSRFSQDKATEIDLIFKHYENIINMTANYAERVWADKENFTPRESYYHNEKVSKVPPGFFYSEDYGYNISFEVSCYKLAPRCFGELSERYLNEEEEKGFYKNVNASINSTIENSSKIEDILILQKRENPDLTLIYFGTEVGVHRSYPWHNYAKEYDPVVRGWYKNAKAHPDRVYWGTPYMDASGQGLIISGSRVVRDLSTEKREVIGVVGVDIKINTIREEILGFSVYNTGYSFLIDSQGNTIAHRDLKPAEGTDWTSGDLKNPITVYEGEVFESVMEKMLNGESGVEVVNYGNTTKFVGFAPIPSTGFSLAIVADSEEVLKTVKETEKKINEKREETINSIFTLILGTVVVVLIIGVTLARKIVNPLRHLTQTALEVSQGELDQTIHVLSKDEIGKLAKAFEKMVAALKKANIMIAREEHKGGTNFSEDSQEKARKKAEELLGVGSSSSLGSESEAGDEKLSGQKIVISSSSDSPWAPREERHEEDDEAPQDETVVDEG